ncbi:MAG: NAD-dependent epimerase/dehydratase family protein, partial [Candidatus Marinimicrobia bacterium]|nr:NAD-dependent epimerase/dehydratase family protein [Candidatus Neomarinimicrobiota bacterium]
IQEQVQQYIVFGCYRMYGEASVVPTPEEAQNQCEFPELAERFSDILGIQNQSIADGVQFTALVPTEIMGPGAVPLNGYGGYELSVHQQHAMGKSIKLPIGGHSLFAPVDVEDVARALLAVVNNPARSAGEILNVGPGYAITLDKFVQELSTAYRTNIPLEYIPWDEFFHEHNPDPRTNYIFRAHMAPDISKLRRILQFEPMIAPEAVIERSIDWMRKNQLI